MKTNYLLLFIMALGFSGNIYSQQTYKTINGDIAISIKYGDSALLMISNQLLVLLEYETSKVSFHVGYGTFQTRVDSIDEQLRKLKGLYLDFAGKLGIIINTRNFAPQKYNLEGFLTNIVPPIPVKGNGSMTCLPAGDRATPACTLVLSFETTLASLNLTEIFPTAPSVVRVDIRQSVLEREGGNN